MSKFSKTLAGTIVSVAAMMALGFTVSATEVKWTYTVYTTYTSGSYAMTGTFTKIKLEEDPICAYSVATMTDTLQEKNGLLWNTKDLDQTHAVADGKHTSWWYADDEDNYRIKVKAMNNVEENSGLNDITWGIYCADSRLYTSN